MPEIAREFNSRVGW